MFILDSSASEGLSEGFKPQQRRQAFQLSQIFLAALNVKKYRASKSSHASQIAFTKHTHTIYYTCSLTTFHSISHQTHPFPSLTPTAVTAKQPWSNSKKSKTRSSTKHNPVQSETTTIPTTLSTRVCDYLLCIGS